MPVDAGLISIGSLPRRAEDHCTVWRSSTRSCHTKESDNLCPSHTSLDPHFFDCLHHGECLWQHVPLERILVDVAKASAFVFTVRGVLSAEARNRVVMNHLHKSDTLVVVHRIAARWREGLLELPRLR